MGRNIDSLPIVFVDGPETSYVRDLNIVENLVGSSQNVFVGRVIGQSVNQKGGSQTQFDVDVVLNIKGKLQGQVRINTYAWHHNGTIRVRKGSVWPKSGSTYVFATRYNSGEDLYRLISFTLGDVASKLISDDASLTRAQLRQIAESDSRVQELQAAYPREVIPSADIYNNNVHNSYQSLSEAEKAALPYYTPPPQTSSVTSTPTSTEQ